MSDALYPTFAFIGFILVLIPLPWHLNAWNAGTCLFMIWTAIGCLIHFVNSLVWADNLELHSAPWCDISTKLIVGCSVGLPCASLCINRRLYSIARVSQVHTTKAEKLRGVYIDLAIGVGFPIIVMALHYIVQGHRFDIFEDIGCWPSTVNMAPAYPLVWMWPILIGLISMVFCVLSLNAFMRRRTEFHELLATNQNLNMNRYFRLMALATIEITTTTPVAIYFLYLNLTTTPISPWVSWSDTKWHFSRIDYVPAWIVNANPQLKLNFSLNLWLFPACALLFFGFFGFAEEARRNYKKLFYIFAKPFGITPPTYAQRMMRGRQAFANVNVTLPSRHTSSADGTSEHGAKWDELSLKMPEITYDSSLPPSAAPPLGMDTTRSVSFAAPSHIPRSVSLDDSHRPRPTSLDTSEYSSSSSFTSEDHSNLPSPTHTPMYAHNPRVPAVNVTGPDSDASFMSHNDVTTSPTQTLPPPPRRIASPTSRPISHHATSSDPDISVSPAYLLHDSTLSRYDEVFLARDTPDSALSSHPLGGIRMTVEKNVV